jgi:DNA-binding SARP family transcriptional activator
VKAAVKLAEAHAAANEHSRAGDLAQFITAVAPDFDDEHQLRKLLRMLHRQGNRVAALRVFDDFSRRLQETYGTTPAAETRNLISEIRSG